MYYKAYDRRAIYVYRNLPQYILEDDNQENDGDGIFMFLIIVVFLIFLFAMKDIHNPVEQAKADMIQRCVKEKEPPSYCSNIAKKYFKD